MAKINRTKTKSVANLRKRMPSKSNIGKRLSMDAIRVIERRYQVVGLRRDGYSIKEISDTLNISVETARKDLEFLLTHTIKETAETCEENRQIQIERLDLLIKSYTPLATQWHKEVRVNKDGSECVIECPPNPAYATLILNVEQRRAKLLALDVPETKNINHTGIREYVGVNMEEV